MDEQTHTSGKDWSVNSWAVDASSPAVFWNSVGTSHTPAHNTQTHDYMYTFHTYIHVYEKHVHSTHVHVCTFMMYHMYMCTYNVHVKNLSFNLQNRDRIYLASIRNRPVH